MLDILELRAYARAKHALERAQSEQEVPQTPMVELVWRVKHELLRRRNATLDGGQQQAADTEREGSP